jgi:hypothetical protein
VYLFGRCDGKEKNEKITEFKGKVINKSRREEM